MQSTLSQADFDHFFAVLPIVFGIIIYVIFIVAKRHETAPSTSPIGQTFACAKCGRRGHRDHMIAQPHDGAVSWYCAHCSAR